MPLISCGSTAAHLVLNQTELSEFFVKEAKVALNPGESFGPGGEQHMRLNTACPRSTLETGLERIEAAAARRCALLG